MAEDSNKDRSYAGGFTESGFDASIPVWDGKADSLREFRRMTNWWLHSINLEKTKEFNLAARFAMKQKGAAKLRALEFTPEELAYTPAETVVDPDTDETLVISEVKYNAGIVKILDAWDQMVGRSLNDKKGELREKFYLHTRRNPQEAVMTFALRYRNLMSEMKQEGITIDDAEAAWFYKQKLGLSELQKQMMETTLGTETEDYTACERESIRLFKRMHLGGGGQQHRPGPPGHRPGLTHQALRRHRGPPSSTTASSSSSWSRGSRSAPSRYSSVNVAEQEDNIPEETYDEETAENDVLEAEYDMEDTNEDEAYQVLQSEVEVLATELEKAAEEGCPEEELAEVEDQLDNAVEALATLREARAQISALRKDRGFKGPDAKGKGKGSSKDAKGIQCFNCDEFGHYSRDSPKKKRGSTSNDKTGPRFPKARNPAAMRSSTPRRPPGRSDANVSEANVVNLLPDFPKVQFSEVSFSETPVVHEIHEACVVSTLSEALHTSALAPSPLLEADKMYQAAVDSACNRTVCGQEWLDLMLEAVTEAPKAIQQLVVRVPENEMFRFGNGGCLVSRERVRLPLCIFNKVILVWVSVVPSPSLGCLFGKDWLESLGAVLDFVGQRLKLETLDKNKWVKLSKMRAGHFALYLLPHYQKSWPLLHETWPWVSTGRGAVSEIQCEGRLRLKLQRLAQQISGDAEAQVAQHFVPEAFCPQEIQDGSRVRPRNRTAMVPDGGSVVEPDSVALARSDAVVDPTASPEVRTGSIASDYLREGVEGPSGGDGAAGQLGEAMACERELRNPGAQGRHHSSQAHGQRRGIHGGRVHHPGIPADEEEGQACGAEGDRGRDPPSDVHGSSRTRTPTPYSHRTPRRTSKATQRARRAGDVALRGRGRQGYRGEVEGQGFPGDCHDPRRQDQKRPRDRSGESGEERREGSRSRSGSSGIRPLSGRRSTSRTSEEGESISTMRSWCSEESELLSPDVGGLPSGGVGEDDQHYGDRISGDRSGSDVDPTAGGSHDGGDGRQPGARGVRPERLRASGSSLKEKDYEVAVATLVSVAGGPGWQLPKMKTGVKVAVQQAAQKSLKLHGVLGASTRKIEEVLTAEHETEVTEISMALREAFIGEIILPEFSKMGRSQRRFVPRGGLLRFPYENRVPDEWRLGHSGKWICKDHHIPRQRLCVPVNCGGPPKAIHPTAFTGNRWTRSFLRDGTEQPDVSDNFHTGDRMRMLPYLWTGETWFELAEAQIRRMYQQVDPETEFPKELQRILKADLENDNPELHGRFQVTEDGDEVYLMPDAFFAAAPVPQNKDVRVSVYLCDDEGNWEKVWNKIQWSRLPQHHMQSRALAVTQDYYMMYYHNAEYEYHLEMKTNGRLEKIPKEKRGALLGEVFTDTEPIALAAAWKGHTVMPSISLKMGYDLYKEEDRDRCDFEVTRKKPFLLVLAFPCRVWSPLQHLTIASAPNAMIRQQQKKRQRLAKLKEKKLVKYTVKKARDQVAEGRHFLVENPAGSQAWQHVPEMKELCEDEDVYSVVVDMCQFGLRGPGGGLHKKSTRLLTSSEEVYKELSAVPRCSGNHGTNLSLVDPE